MSDRLNGLFRRLTGSWVAPGVVLAAWMVWAYLRSYPRGAAVKGGVLLRYYGLWSIKRFSYSDVLLLYRVHHLANHAAPYVHTTIEYPVLTGLFMWTAAWFHGVQGYFLASSVGLGLCGLGTVYLLHRATPWAAWAFALNPLLLVYSLLNWDLFGIFLMVAAWTAWRADRHIAAGVMFAMAVWAKLFPGVLFIYCAIDSWRRRRELGTSGVVRLLSAAAVTTLVINLPFALVNLKGWSEFFKLNVTRRGGDGVLFELRIVSHWSHGAANALIAGIVICGMLALAGYVARNGGAEFRGRSRLRLVDAIQQGVLAPVHALGARLCHPRRLVLADGGTDQCRRLSGLLELFHHLVPVEDKFARLWVVDVPRLLPRARLSPERHCHRSCRVALGCARHQKSEI